MSLEVKRVIAESQQQELTIYKAAVHELELPPQLSMHKLPQVSSIKLALPVVINKTEKIMLIINITKAVILIYFPAPPNNAIITPNTVNVNCARRK